MRKTLTKLGKDIVTSATSLGLLATPVAAQDHQTSSIPSIPKNNQLSFIVGGKFNDFPEGHLNKIPHLIVPRGSRSLEVGLQYRNLAGVLNHYTDKDNLVREITASDITPESHTILRKGVRDFSSIGGSLEYYSGPFLIGAGIDRWKYKDYSTETDVQRKDKNILVLDPVIDDGERMVNTNSTPKSEMNGRGYVGIRILRDKSIGLGLIAGIHKKGFYTGARLYFNPGKRHRNKK